MLREMEKVFENLKEEFNRKISTESFISYFVKQNDVSREGSSSDSFEDLSTEGNLLGIVSSTRDSIDEELLKVSDSHLTSFEERCDVQKSTINNNETREFDMQLDTLTGVKGKRTENDCIKEMLGYSREDLRYGCNSITSISFEESISASLKVINEEDVNEQCTHPEEPLQNIIQKETDEFIEIIDVTLQSTEKDKEDIGVIQEILTPSNEQLAEILTEKNIESKIEIVRQQKVRKQHDSSVPNSVKKQFLHRMMWSEMPEVIESGLLSTLPRKKIQLQEAMFEIIASEASYYQSLMILTSHFFESDLFKPPENIRDRSVSSTDKHHIFSNVILIMYTSQNFLNDLDQRWREEKPFLTEICDIILKHTSGDDFQNYVTYLRNQEYQRKALKRLSENEVFKHQLHKLENSSVCGKLSMDSYLMLPMQRLTRLKLLVEALLKLLSGDELKAMVPEKHIDTAEMTLEKIKQLLDTSDLEKGIMDQKSTLMLLMNRMDFPDSFKRITISDKAFIKEDDVRVHHQNHIKHIRKFSKKRQPIINLILFNDLLIIAKKKGTRLLVLDYCDRDNIEVSETQYKAIVSSADVSSNISMIDFPDSQDEVRKISVSTLARSKTSMSPDDWKKFNSTLAHSFRSMSLTNRNDEQEIVNNSFQLKFTKSQTDIFSAPMVLLTRDKDLRDEWMHLLTSTSTNDGRLHKTTSLRNNTSKKDDFRLNKYKSLYGKKSDGTL